jgi:hypothetical protein
MFRECFGFGYADMKSQLEGYLPAAVSQRILFVSRGLDWNQKVPKLRDATEAEIARIAGDWERIMGCSLAATNAEAGRAYLEEAGKTLMKPYDKGNRDPQLLGVLGLYEHAVGDDVKARAFLEAVAKGQVARPSVYLTLAQLRYLESEAHPDGPEEKFSSNQVAAVLTPLITAQSQSPVLEGTYLLMADTLSRGVVKPTPGQLSVLDEGVRLFWTDSTLADAVAKLRAQWGYAAN